MPYAFGQDFIVEFYPMLDEEPAIPSADSPSIYVYTDTNKPTRAQAAAGGGTVLQTISTWSDINNGKSISVSAISDPDADSDTTEYTYWMAINFTLKASGDTQTVLKALKMYRINGMLATITTKTHDIENMWGAVKEYTTEAERAAFIADAIDDIKADLRARGYEWAKINRADRLNSAAVNKACANIALSQIRESGDRFDVMKEECKQNYEKKINSIRLEYDSTLTGEADTVVGGIRSSINIR